MHGFIRHVWQTTPGHTHRPHANAQTPCTHTPTTHTPHTHPTHRPVFWIKCALVWQTAWRICAWTGWTRECFIFLRESAVISEGGCLVVSQWWRVPSGESVVEGA